MSPSKDHVNYTAEDAPNPDIVDGNNPETIFTPVEPEGLSFAGLALWRLQYRSKKSPATSPVEVGSELDIDPEDEEEITDIVIPELHIPESPEDTRWRELVLHTVKRDLSSENVLLKRFRDITPEDAQEYQMRLAQHGIISPRLSQTYSSTGYKVLKGMTDSPEVIRSVAIMLAEQRVRDAHEINGGVTPIKEKSEQINVINGDLLPVGASLGISFPDMDTVVDKLAEAGFVEPRFVSRAKKSTNEDGETVVTLGKKNFPHMQRVTSKVSFTGSIEGIQEGLQAVFDRFPIIQPEKDSEALSEKSPQQHDIDELAELDKAIASRINTKRNQYKTEHQVDIVPQKEMHSIYNKMQEEVFREYLGDDATDEEVAAIMLAHRHYQAQKNRSNRPTRQKR